MNLPKRDKTGRILFTKTMKKTHTILMPQMLPVHFGLLKRCLELDGYKFEILETTDRKIVETGLKYVHNDTCYPALLVIGQLICALQSGKYDLESTAVLLTQTGGGCRASNYINLLRKALKKAGLEHVPVVSLNLSGLEKNPGFKLKLKTVLRMVYGIMYGDILALLKNQVKPYEVEIGATDEKVKFWQNELLGQFARNKGFRAKSYAANLVDIVRDFATIPTVQIPKVKVGIVGEIYVKYAPLGNNKLEEFLLAEGAEPVVPGLADFVLFKIDNRLEDGILYGSNLLKKKIVGALKKYMINRQFDMINAMKNNSKFRAPGDFESIKAKVSGLLGYGNKMGEGWLLTAEMLELIHEGVNNIVCTQPFGCLPNHIVGKGMIRAIKNLHPNSNIVSIDYDPGATKINQENRIKLMLANAKLSEDLAESDAKISQKEPKFNEIKPEKFTKIK